MIKLLVATLLVSSFNPPSQRPAACKQSVFRVLRTMPHLEYSCDEFPNDWNEKSLRHPARVAAIKNLMAQLSSFSNGAWWQASTSDLSVCDFAGKAGALTVDQRGDFRNEYVTWLFGDSRTRLVLIPDPCYQTEYGGSNAFLLYRKGDRVFVTQALDGYFSRADNSVNIAFAKLKGEEIIEISTGSGGLNPTLTNYYFAIDPSTNNAVPKKLFRGEHGPTNEITSAMLFDDAWGFAAPLYIIRGQSLAPRFSIYEEDPDGKVEDNGRKLTRTILRWNGKMYR
jgi:hypothetical protein